jgi:2-beta-glucuronyltransferase
MNIVLISAHYCKSKRKAGFHWLAQTFWEQGHSITFVTTGISWLSYLIHDHRLQYKSLRREANRLVQIEDRYFSYVYFPLWHPIAMPLSSLEHIVKPLWDKYPLFPIDPLFVEKVHQADMVIYESMNGLFLFDRLSKLNPAAKKVYRASDDIRTHRSTSQRLIEIEESLLDKFDLISVPHKTLIEGKFKNFSNAKLQYHGVATSLFDAPSASPYTHSPNCVFVGVSLLDENFIDIASSEFPECTFTIIGPFSAKTQKSNVKYTSEIPFEETVPYIKHADIGLITLLKKNQHASSFSDTLKVHQYRYAGLPIVAPDFIDIHRDNSFYYTPDDAESIVEAMKSALGALKSKNSKSEINDWNVVVQQIIESVT